MPRASTTPARASAKKGAAASPAGKKKATPARVSAVTVTGEQSLVLEAAPVNLTGSAAQSWADYVVNGATAEGRPSANATRAASTGNPASTTTPARPRRGSLLASLNPLAFVSPAAKAAASALSRTTAVVTSPVTAGAAAVRGFASRSKTPSRKSTSRKANTAAAEGPAPRQFVGKFNPFAMPVAAAKYISPFKRAEASPAPGTPGRPSLVRRLATAMTPISRLSQPDLDETDLMPVETRRSPAREERVGTPSRGRISASRPSAQHPSVSPAPTFPTPPAAELDEAAEVERVISAVQTGGAGAVTVGEVKMALAHLGKPLPSGRKDTLVAALLEATADAPMPTSAAKKSAAPSRHVSKSLIETEATPAKSNSKKRSRSVSQSGDRAPSSSWTVAELRDEAEKRGLSAPSKASKAEFLKLLGH